MRPHQVWRHDARARDPADDVLVYEDPDERFFVSVGLSLTEAVGPHQLRLEGDHRGAPDPRRRPDRGAAVVAAPRAGRRVRRHPRAHAGRRPLRHPHQRRRRRELQAHGGARSTTPGRAHWTELVAPPARREARGRRRLRRPPRALRAPRGRAPHRGHALRRRRPSTSWRCPRRCTTPGRPPTPSSTPPSLRFVYTSLVTPSTVFDEDLDTGERTPAEDSTEVLGGHDPGRLRDRPAVGHGARRHAGADLLRAPGAASPATARRRACSTATAPTRRAWTPASRSLRLSLLDRGLRVRHRPRPRRRRDGPALVRRRQAAATSATPSPTSSPAPSTSSPRAAPRPDRLVARGGSAGGLLMGAVANLRPDLFAAVVAEVPFVDCLTTILDETLPLTVTEWEEWGNPVGRPGGLRLHEGATAPTTTSRPRTTRPSSPPAGLNDPRVSYWEPAKWVQELRADHDERPTGLPEDRDGRRPPGPVGPLRRVEGRGVRVRLRPRRPRDGRALLAPGAAGLGARRRGRAPAGAARGQPGWSVPSSYGVPVGPGRRSPWCRSSGSGDRRSDRPGRIGPAGP